MTAPSRVGDPAQAAHPNVMRLSRDEPERFETIFRAHFAEIYRYVAGRIGPASADDVVAETFLAAFHKRASYDPSRGSVRTWLFGIATNLVSKHRRAEVRALRALSRRRPDRDAESHEDRVVVQVSAAGMRPGLAAAIASLSPGDRDVLLLVALAELSHEEIAAALEIPYGTVGSRLNRARRKLREALGGTNPVHEVEEDDRG